jgi:hypothetical protein
VGDGETAAGKFGEKRLHVAQAFAAGGRVAGVADGAVAGQAVHDGALGEGVTDQADMTFNGKLLAVKGDDPGGLLAAVLKRVQSECDHGGSFGLAENAEHATLVMKAICFVFVRFQAIVCHRRRTLHIDPPD